MIIMECTCGKKIVGRTYEEADRNYDRHVEEEHKEIKNMSIEDLEKALRASGGM